MIINEQDEEPEPNVIFAMLRNWIRAGRAGEPIHQMHLFGHGFTGIKYERCYNDIERICFRQNPNREKFAGDDRLPDGNLGGYFRGY